MNRFQIMSRNDLIKRIQACGYFNENAVALIRKDTENIERTYRYDALVDELEHANRKLRQMGIDGTITIESGGKLDEFEIHLNGNLFSIELIQVADMINEIWTAVGFAIRNL